MALFRPEIPLALLETMRADTASASARVNWHHRDVERATTSAKGTSIPSCLLFAGFSLKRYDRSQYSASGRTRDVLTTS
jgi:hypothetical protein